MTPVPVAIVGVSCRFPGGAHDLQSLWQILEAGSNVWSDVPPERYNWTSFFHTSRESNVAHSHRGGHFLAQDVAAFDANFFEITSTEAEAMDPQQRIQLEIAYEALENAGMPLDSVRGSNTSVFVASFTHDYENMMYKDATRMAKYGMTGVGQAIISNRLSYTFDLRGPSVTLDTGCSGSLVALHQACQSLRYGESSMSLVGGTNLILSPDTMIPMDTLHLLNRDGKCYSFDSRGSGYGRGEGVAMVVLKRLDEALRDGDSIRGVIRNTAVGQDGKTSGITLPNGEAQQHLIHSAYASAMLDPATIGYVEAHGTGTVAGDTTEINAITKAFCKGRNSENPLCVGSIKGNIGHLESTSGLAGLLKAILVLEKGIIPPTPNLEILKDRIDLKAANIRIPTNLQCWPAGIPRRASVNSFGYGGSNAHAVLEHADVCCEVPLGADAEHSNRGSKRNMPNQRSWTDMEQGPPRLYLFSVTAKSEQSLVSTLVNLRRLLMAPSKRDSSYILDMAYTLTSRRSFMPWRHTFVASKEEEMLAALVPESLRATRTAKVNRVIFVFTGQGAQWPAMGKELISSYPEFKKSLHHSSAILSKLGASWDLLDELSAEESTSRLHESEFGQPATTALQIGLVEVFLSLGIVPNAVLGHSSGEIAAAYAAGAISKESAIEISYHRGFLAKRCKDLLKVDGGMLAVSIGEEEVSSHISRLTAGRAVVACCNSPLNTTVSGDEDAIVSLKRLLEQSATPARRLRVDTAYHSHHMEAVAQEYLHNIRGVQPKAKDMGINFYSTVTAQEKDSDFGPTYWVSNLVSKVRFFDGFKNVCQQMHDDTSAPQASSCHTFLEIGPHNTLLGPMKQSLTHLKMDGFRLNCISTLRRKRNSQLLFLQAIGHLFEYGVPLDMARINSFENMGRKPSVVTDMAPYPWDHSLSYWHESRLSRNHRLRSHPYHDILGLRCLGDTMIEPSWRHVLSIESLPWLRDHAVDNRLVFPAAGYIAMAMEAKKQITLDRRPTSTIRNYILKDIAFSKVLEIPDSSNGIEIVLSLRHSIGITDWDALSWEEFRVCSISLEGVTNEHCRGYIMVEAVSPPESTDLVHQFEAGATGVLPELQPRSIEKTPFTTIDPKRMYEDWQTRGHYWGPSFALIKEIDVTDFEAAGRLMLGQIARSMPGLLMQPHVIHPTTLDALIHSSLIVYGRTCCRSIMFPVGIEKLVISADLFNSPGEMLMFETSIKPHNLASTSMEVAAFQQRSGSSPQLCVLIKGGELQGTGDSKVTSAGSYGTRDLCYRVDWNIDSDLCQPLQLKSQDESAPDSSISPEKRLDLLERATAYFIKSCLCKIGRPDVQAKYLRYFDWMSRFCTQIQDHDVKGQATKMEIEELGHNRAAGAEGEGLFRVGSNLKSILLGDSDPLSLLLEDGLLRRLYTENLAAQRCFIHLTDYVRRLIFKNPSMKVLEIGAGTAGLTLPLLRSLSSEGELTFERYDFTDVSSGFFEDAQQKLRDWVGTISYSTLDIGKDPIQQGFVGGSYDLILAYNALHVTASIDDAIINARKLIKPGGRLILIEITRLVSYVNMIFGLLPGWYMGKNVSDPLTGTTERNDGRIESPVMSTDQWNERLLQNSFSGIEFQAHDHDEATSTVTMMVSKACPAETALRFPRNFQVLVEADIMLDGYGLTQRLVQMFKVKSIETFVRRLTLQDSPNSAFYMIVDDDEHPLMTESSAKVARSVLSLLVQATNVLWIARKDNPRASSSQECVPAADLARAARAANDALKLVTLGVQQGLDTLPVDFDQKIFEILQNCFLAPTTICETEYVYKDGLMLIPRLKTDVQLKDYIRKVNGEPIQADFFHQDDRCLRLHYEAPEKLHGLRFVDSPDASQPIQPWEIEIQCQAFGVNLEPTPVALSETKVTRQTMGECAGTVTRIGSDLKDRYEIGDRVCGWGKISYASRNRVRGNNAHHLLPVLSFAVGASIPVAFLTAYYALINVANISRGHTVLVHSAAESIGQAAMQIVHHIGAKMLVTVRNVSERKLIAEVFKVSQHHIFSTSSKDLRKEVHGVTKDRGVDVILGSLTGEDLENGLACLAHFGKFIDIGASHERTMFSDSKRRLLENTTYVSANIAAFSEYQPEETCNIMSRVLTMFESGVLQAVHPLQKLELPDINEAFKVVKNKNHVGKLVLEANSDTKVNCPPRPGNPMELCPEGTYVLAGDFCDLGLDICRFMVSRGAKHIALISWGHIAFAQQKCLEETLRQLGASIHMIPSQDSNQDLTDELMTRYFKDMPPVKGVVQADLMLQSGLLDSLSPEEFAVIFRSKSEGTRMLLETLNVSQVDFFLLLSSSAKVLGSKRHRNYAEASALQVAKFMDQVDDTTKCVTVDLGGMKDSCLVSQNVQLEEDLFAEGLIPMKTSELDAILQYAIHERVQKASVDHIITGFDRESLMGSKNAGVLEEALFSHLSRTGLTNEKQENVTSSQVRDQTIAGAKTRQEAQRIVISALQQKISTLVTIEPQMIDPSTPMEDFGLDSLIMWGMRNWIFGNFRADLDPAEISDAASIASLASRIIDRSKFITEKEHPHDSKDTGSIKKLHVRPDFPQQPLPSLDATLQAYLDVARPFCSDEEFDRTSLRVAEFKAPNGFGQQLQSRLAQREEDGTVEHWLWDGLYTQRRFLRLRTPVIACSTYFGTHPFGSVPQTQAERATIISLAAFDFMRDLESGKLEGFQSSLSGQVIDPETYQFLFKACREPHVEEDQIVKYPSDDYIVVLKHGHAFRVNLRDDSGTISFWSLKGILEGIIAAAPQEMSWIGVLTADQRDRWAKARKDLIELNNTNKMSLHVIEAAAFVVCLDNAEPGNSSERCNQFLYGAASNRWYDKTLQLVVCENGVSASVCEHSALDGVSVEPLHDYINKAIREFDPQATQRGEAKSNAASSPEELPLSGNTAIDKAIYRIQHEFDHLNSKFTFASVEVSTLGQDFLRSHKCPSQSGVQLAIQLACQRFFGYNPPALETVSMAHFRKGRVEVHHIIGSAVARFLEATKEVETSPQNLRVVFLDAARAHAKSLSRVSKGKGFSRHLLALEWMLREGEEKPKLFEDPVYLRLKPGKIMTSNFTTGWLEGGFFYPVPESILVYFEIRDESVSFSIFGNGVDAGIFRERLESAAEQCRVILDEDADDL